MSAIYTSRQMKVKSEIVTDTPVKIFYQPRKLALITKSQLGGGGKRQKIVNQTQMSSTAFIVVVHMEILGVGRNESNVRILEA